MTTTTAPTTTSPGVDQSQLAATLATRGEPGSKPESIFDYIRAQGSAIERALPRVGVTAERFTRLVTTEVRRNKKLASCTPISLLGAMMYAAQLGVEPGPLGHAYLVPYWSGKAQAFEATFILGYRGIIELAFRSGTLASIEAREVCENDEFSFAYGLDERLVHEPKLEDRGEPMAYYGIARYRDGGRYWLVMSLSDVLARRDRSQSAQADFSPWKSDFGAMARKSVVRAMAPYMPLSTELAEAIATDEAVRVFDPDAVGGSRLRELGPGDGDPMPDPPAPTDEVDVPLVVDGIPLMPETVAALQRAKDRTREETTDPAEEVCVDCANPFTGGAGKRRVDTDAGPYHESCAP